MWEIDEISNRWNNNNSDWGRYNEIKKVIELDNEDNKDRQKKFIAEDLAIEGVMKRAYRIRKAWTNGKRNKRKIYYYYQILNTAKQSLEKRYYGISRSI